MSRWPWFSRPDRDQELDAEIQAHLDLATRDRLERGETPETARLAVRREFGNRTLVKEVTREMWGWSSVERLWQDLRYGLRTMRRSPGFTAVAVLSLALGIGANTAIFSLINTLMLRELPVREPKQLVELLSRYPGEPDINVFSWTVYEHFRDRNHVFSDLIATSASRFQVASEGRDVETVDGEYVVGTFFPALGVQPAIGRLLGPQDDQVGHADAAVAVVSWSYWKNRFNLDPSMLGKRIVLDGLPATIVGATRPEFLGVEVGAKPDLWVPAAVETMIHQPSRRSIGQFELKLMGRLKPGVTIDQARAEMSVLDQWRIDEIVRIRKNSDPLWRQLKLGVEPAAVGFRTLRDHYARPLLAFDGRGGRAPADRVHQRRKPATGARGGAATGNGGARVAWRGPGAAGPTGVDRIAAAVWRGKPARSVPGVFRR
jgi:hypothetical protein